MMAIPNLLVKDIDDHIPGIIPELTNQSKAKIIPPQEHNKYQKVDKCSLFYLFLICLIVVSSLLYQVVEVRKAGQPSFPIQLVRFGMTRLKRPI